MMNHQRFTPKLTPHICNHSLFTPPGARHVRSIIKPIRKPRHEAVYERYNKRAAPYTERVHDLAEPWAYHLGHSALDLLDPRSRT